MLTATTQKRKTVTTFWCVLACFVGSLFFLLFQGGKLASMLFAVMLILSVYLALGRWSGITKAQGKRVLHGIGPEGLVAAGSPVTVQIQTEIPGFWPIPYVFVKDRLSRRNGGEMTFDASFVPDWRRRGSLEYTTPPMRRGFYYFGSTKCTTEDIFGLFEHSGTLEMPGSFGVLPQTVPIKEWKQYHQLMKGMHHHSATNRAMRETTQINGVREYHYGDRLSRIHWNATAKTGEFKSKEFERESLPKSILVLDRNRNAYADQEQFELAVSVTASLLEFAFQRDIALGLLSVGKDCVYFDPSRSAVQQRLMLNHLIDVEADGTHPLLHVLQTQARTFVPGSFFALITPEQSEPMKQVLDWMDAFQMNPCHFWLAADASRASQDAWLNVLRKRGCTGYAIRALSELPLVLGGRLS